MFGKVRKRERVYLLLDMMRWSELLHIALRVWHHYLADVRNVYVVVFVLLLGCRTHNVPLMGAATIILPTNPRVC